MPADFRLPDFTFHAPAGVTLAMEFISPTALTSLSVYLGGTLADLDDFTNATEYAATIGNVDAEGTTIGVNRVASVNVDIPANIPSTPTRLVINGAVETSGQCIPDVAGRNSPSTYSVTLAASTITVNLTIPGVVESGGGGGGVQRTALRLPGVAGNDVSTPDHASLAITGSVDLRAKAAPGLSGGYQAILSKGTRSYELGVNGAGTIRFIAQRADSTELNVSSPQVAFSAAGQMRWVRATFNSGTGQVQFFASDDDGVTWVSLGNVASLPTTLLANADSFRVGQRQSSLFPFDGSVARAQVYDGIDGTLVADYRADTPMGPRYQDSTGKVWTINGSTWTWVVA